MKNEFTLSQMQRLGIVDKPVQEIHDRGWSRDEIKTAFYTRRFTFAGFERELNLPAGSVSQSLTRRFPKVDRLISAFLDVPVHILWPHRYLRNGKIMDFRYRAETLSDEELEKLNNTVSGVVTLPLGMKCD